MVDEPNALLALRDEAEALAAEQAASPEAELEEEGAEVEEEAEGTAPSGDEEDAEEFDAFYDAAQVPTGLKPTFKEMKSSYTKKTQEVAQMKRDLASREQALGDAQYESQLFRQLMGDQRVKSYLLKLRQQDAGLGGESEDLDDVGGGGDSAETRAQIRALQSKIVSLEQGVSLSRERQEFERQHPDWSDYEDGMKKAWREDPRRSIKDAYLAARFEASKRQERSQKRRKKAVKAGVEKPGGGGQEPSSPRKKGWDNAVARALKAHGMSLKDLEM